MTLYALDVHSVAAIFGSSASQEERQRLKHQHRLMSRAIQPAAGNPIEWGSSTSHCEDEVCFTCSGAKSTGSQALVEGLHTATPRCVAENYSTWEEHQFRVVSPKLAQDSRAPQASHFPVVGKAPGERREVPVVTAQPVAAKAPRPVSRTSPPFHLPFRSMNELVNC